MEPRSDTLHFPACFVQLPPECEGRRAAFYLAAEEYVAATLPKDSYFLTWQIGPTVVMGRNQVAHQEVDLDFCHQNGIDVIRRRSGGGAIFADERNIMTSLVTEGCPVEPLFQEYAQAVTHALRQLGAPVQVSGRNDIVLEQGGKICGNAFYHKQERCIAHGTMLYDTNPQLMEGALHPDIGKWEKKGVNSVRSRIGLLKDCLSISVDELRRQLRLLLTDRSIMLSDNDIKKIENLEREYYREDFLLGTPTHANVTKARRIEGCGTVEMRLFIEGSLIENVEVRGDFFDLDHAQEAMQQALCGTPFTLESVRRAIDNWHPERSIRGLDKKSLLNLIIS